MISGVPAAPSNLTVTDVSTTEATLQWTHISISDKPESFLANCLSASNTNVTSLVYTEELANTTNYTHLLTGLEEYTNYTCFVTPRNIFGEGPTSDTITLMTTTAGIHKYP